MQSLVFGRRRPIRETFTNVNKNHNFPQHERLVLTSYGGVNRTVATTKARRSHGAGACGTMKVVASSLVGLLLLLWSNRSCADSSVGSDPPSTDRPFESLGLGPGPLDGAAGGPPKSPRKSSSVASDLLPLPINNTNCGGSSSSNATNRKRPKGSTSSLQGALRSRSIGPGTNLLSHSPSPPSETARESSNHSLCQDAQPEQSEEVSACTAVAEETAVTQEPSTTFRLELDLLATASKAKSMGFQLRQALQSQIAPILTSCNDRDRRLVEGPSNVVFGKLSVEDLSE